MVVLSLSPAILRFGCSPIQFGLGILSYSSSKDPGLSDKLKPNVVKISRKLNFKRLFTPSTNGAVKFQVLVDC
ncbi:hypothetical protein OROMI_012387 [Orobanche minor]